MFPFASHLVTHTVSQSAYGNEARGQREGENDKQIFIHPTEEIRGKEG